MEPGLSAPVMLAGYAHGVFPMAMDRADAQLHWFDPPERGIMPLGAVHMSRSMARHLRGCDWRATLDGSFAQVVDLCADRDETWINAPLRALYLELHAMGHAHSLEIRDAQGQITGAIFGLHLGGAFFGESMISPRTNGSKAALLWLAMLLAEAGFVLFDTQYLTPHLASLGGREVPRAIYRDALSRALALRPRNLATTPMPDAAALIAHYRRQEITQTS